MPKISRVRIANILYDGKYISDEIYDSYNGENMLINLRNGSGKSVLVQLMMQPVNPCCVIHKRSMESYLDRKNPSFVFVEWKLDNTPVPTYFLTGIVMVKSAPNENEISRIKYFAFTNRYTESCEFDITDMPFIVHDGRGLYFESYAKCREIIKDNIRAGSDFDYFSAENMDKYTEKLAENGIYRNEWKTIADCNEEEGGISNLFKGIDTSDKLFDEWILKTIVNNTQLGDNLHEMFVALIEDINNNEDTIRREEVFEEFLNDVDGYVERLKELMDNFDDAEHQQKNIAEVYYFLADREMAAETNISDCNDALAINKEQVNRLKYEELSDKYYDALDLYKTACDNAAEAAADAEKAQAECSEAQKEADILKAVELYNNYKKAKGYAEAYKTELSEIDMGEDKARYDNLVCTLNDIYSAQLKAISEQAKECAEISNAISNEIKALEDEKSKRICDNNTLSVQKGSLENEICRFEDYEKTVFDKLNISPIRNIMGECDVDFISDIEQSFENTRQALDGQLENNEQQINNLTEKRKQLKHETKLVTDKKEQAIKQSVVVENEIEKYKQAEEKALAALHYFGMKDSSLFDRDMALITIRQQEVNLSKKIDDYRREYNALEDYRSSIIKGAAHISPEFTEILTQNRINFEIGEQYLEKETEERREKLLFSNPMLPFCYIVTQKDYEKISKLTFSESINKIIPVVTYEEMWNANRLGDRVVEFDGRNLFVCLYNEDCIDEDKKKNYIELLNTEMENISKNLSVLEEELDLFKSNKSDFMAFDYRRDYYTSKKKEKSELEKSIVFNSNRIEEIESEDQSAENSIAEITADSTNIEKQLETNEQNKKIFFEYKSENDNYSSNRKRLTEVEGCIAENSKRNREIDEATAELTGRKNDCENKIRELNSEHDNVSNKLAELDKTVSGTCLDISAEQAEAELERILSKRKDSADSLKDRISEKEKEAEKARKQLEKLNVSEEEYTNPDIIFNDELLEAAEQRAQSKEIRLSELKETHSKMLVEHGKCEGAFKAEEKHIKDARHENPLDRSEIKRNYPERKNLLAEKRCRTEERLEKNIRIFNLCRDKRNQLKGTFGMFTGRKLFTTDNIEQINPQELKDALEDLKKSRVSITRKLSDTYRNVAEKYSECKYTVVHDFIGNMNPENADSFETSFDVFERVKNCKECLSAELDLAKNALKNIENEKTLFIRQAIEQGKRIYGEARDMSNLSKVKIDGKLRQMLDINVPDRIDADCENNMKLKLDKFLTELRSMDVSDSKGKQKLRQIIEKTFSNRELLNIVIGSRHIPIKLYKVDATSGNGGLRTWEEAIKENSGAQMFVSTFSFISTIIDYERRKIAEINGVTNAFSKAFIIDNPFGTTSSKPFLDAMISVAEKFDVQLICLSDLSQSSITNKFNVIHQLALKNPLYGNKAYLKTEKTIINGDAHKNSKLEHISMKVEQMSFF